jgi:hypothetical protein
VTVRTDLEYEPYSIEYKFKVAVRTSRYGLRRLVGGFLPDSKPPAATGLWSLPIIGVTTNRRDDPMNS